MSPAGLFAARPEAHVPHALHGSDRLFRETNCYVDLVIEVLHALGLEPRACLGFVLGTDFEGDQWTFGKPGHQDLERLYGVRIEELSLFRPLLEHLTEQTTRGRLPLCEVDAFYLPDTEGSDYRRGHTKTTIGVTFVQPEQRVLRYFHNAGYFELSGEDFDGLLRVAGAALPPYCEILKPDRAAALPKSELRARSIAVATAHLSARPAHNPVRAYGESFGAHVAAIAAGGEAPYHAYSFAGLRQLGACAELGASYAAYVGEGATDCEAQTCAQASESLLQVAQTAKMVILKLSRVAHGGRAADFSASFDAMSAAWERGVAGLSGALR